MAVKSKKNVLLTFEDIFNLPLVKIKHVSKRAKCKSICWQKGVSGQKLKLAAPKFASGGVKMLSLASMRVSVSKFS